MLELPRMGSLQVYRNAFGGTRKGVILWWHKEGDRRSSKKGGASFSQWLSVSAGLNCLLNWGFGGLPSEL